jgi:hypothetical protein
MTTHNYKSALASAPARYHRAQRGGNKVLRDYLERNNYNNDSLLACGYVCRDNNKHLNNTIMATKNLLTSGLGVNVLRGVRSRMFNDFCESLCASLASSASASCGVGRLTYAALIATWRKDTANSAYVLNESEGRKLYSANPEDSRVRRIGVEGHWSFFVSPSAEGGTDDNNRESDSISVLVGGWLRSWSSWYDSVVCYGHYGADGVPAASSITAGLLDRCRALWSSRGVGGRTAATPEEKAQKKVAKAVAGLSAAELLAALRASGVDLSALVGGNTQSGNNVKG